MHAQARHLQKSDIVFVRAASLKYAWHNGMSPAWWCADARPGQAPADKVTLLLLQQPRFIMRGVSPDWWCADASPGQAPTTE